MKYKKRSTALVILLMATLISGFFSYQGQQESQERQDAYLEEFPKLYHAALESFRLTSKSTYHTLIEKEPVLSILRQLPSADEQQVETLHWQLYELLKKDYHLLQEDTGIRQMHFHLADGRSFLRMHRPEKYLDPLFDVRQTVQATNQEKRFTYGFEEGRIFNGIRYVFPIIEAGVHLGSVELSYSMAAIINWLNGIHPASDFYFLMDQRLVTAKVFQSEQSNYQHSQIAPEYFEDIEVNQASDSKIQLKIATIATHLDIG